MNDKAIAVPASMHILERGWLSSNNVLFIGRDDTALVDSGYLTHVPQTLALVEHALGERRLDRVLNTHLHSDHCGGNAALKARYGSRIAIPVAEAAANLVARIATLGLEQTGSFHHANGEPLPW